MKPLVILKDCFSSAASPFVATTDEKNVHALKL
jgi:hypothetical protein